MMKMRHTYSKQLLYAITVLLFSGSLLLGGCTNINPLEPQPPYSTTPPSKPSDQADEFKVTYNYNATDKVQLSANNITLKVGQKLILEPAPGLTKNTRFTSSGEYFFGDIMQQQGDPKETGKAIFVAIKPGKGKLQIIPNSTEVDRAVDLWVTVQ